MKLKAYHQILGPSALDNVLKEGVIFPAAYRLDVSWMEQQCAKFSEDLRKKSSQGDSEGFRAIEGAIEDAIHDIKVTQKNAGVVGSQRKTGLQCQDIMFGDADKIFLSPGGFRLKGARTGLAFDAYDLVERGAVIRGIDYIYAYQEVIDEAIHGGETYPEYDGWDRFEALSSDVRERLVSGPEYLDQEVRQKTIGQAEIVWEGPLPVDWAIEVIRNGRVSRLKSQKG